MFDEFFGVQMHPLAVHAPVVLIPIFAVATIVVLSREVWRRRVARWLAGGIGVSVVLLFVARQSGVSAYDDGNGNVLGFGDVERHQELGNQTFVLGLVWGVVVGAAVLAERTRRTPVTADLSASVSTDVRRDPVVLGLWAITAVLGIVVTVWMIRTGHAGAESRGW